MAGLLQVTIEPLQHLQNAAVRFYQFTLVYPAQVVFYQTVHSCWKMPCQQDAVHSYCHRRFGEQAFSYATWNSLPAELEGT